MTSEKNFVPLIKQALTNIVENIEFKKTNSTALLSLRILSSAILALCRDAFSLLENNRIFTACSLVCQATEAKYNYCALINYMIPKVGIIMNLLL